eukprot:1682726-Lingulodinium_polyedra.AAC.1
MGNASSPLPTDPAAYSKCHFFFQFEIQFQAENRIVTTIFWRAGKAAYDNCRPWGRPRSRLAPAAPLRLQPAGPGKGPAPPPPPRR